MHRPIDDPERKPGLSRRWFLKGAGVSAAAAALTESGLADAAEAQAESAKEKVYGPGPVAITLNVNGQDRQLHVEPCTTLADALRTDLDLTGTKIVCDRGACSACTVHLDGTPVCSCMTLAVDVGARKVTTIEGLSDGEKLHPLQEAFIRHDGFQCGYCTPGQIMSGVACIREGHAGSAAEVREYMSGNLCRCGAYPNIVDAILEVKKEGLKV